MSAAAGVSAAAGSVAVPAFRRWRSASYRHTAEATETFRLSTAPIIGILTSRSQVLLVRSRMPRSSAPSTKATGPDRSRSWIESVAASLVPTIRMSRSLSSSIVRARLVTMKYGTVSEAPLATLATVALMPTAWSRGTITPCAPTPSATRRQAPRLCGSVTPSSSSSSGGPSTPSRWSSIECVTGSGDTKAITPWWRGLPTSLSMRLASLSTRLRPASRARSRNWRIRPSRRVGSKWISRIVSGAVFRRTWMA